jgi:hypothetical protein
LSQRISPPRIFPEGTLAPRPPAGNAGAQDAHRQTGFVLGSETEAIVSGLEAEGEVAQASSVTKYRTQRMIAAMGPWSRSWLTRLEALHALQWGNYAASLPLLRAAADYESASLAMLGSDLAEWETWLAEGGIALAPAQHATEYRLHAFRSAETMAAHPILGPVYRAVTDLSLPHFGATLLVAANESDATRIAMTFGDRDFHLGLAELCLGYLALLGKARLDALLAHASVFAIPDRGSLQNVSLQLEELAARKDRCSLEFIEVGGMSRYLVHNWRRTPGSAAKKILL